MTLCDGELYCAVSFGDRTELNCDSLTIIKLRYFSYTTVESQWLGHL